MTSSFSHSPLQASQITLAVPSPPSAIGRLKHFASGHTALIPAATAAQASAAVRVPLNLSQAISTVGPVVMVGWIEVRISMMGVTGGHCQRVWRPMLDIQC